MPRIDDIVQVAKKPFKKKAYRPWNLLDDFITTQKVNNDEMSNKVAENSQPVIVTTQKIDAHVKKTNKEKVSIGKQLDTDLDNKRVTNDETFSYPKDNKYKTDIRVEKTISKQLDSRLVNALVNNFENPSAKKRGVSEEISRLTGHQKKILFFVVEDCASQGLLTTGQITNETLRILLNTDQNTVKTSVHRLISKGLIKREEGKRGNGGFTCYTISEAVRNIVIQAKQKHILSNQLDNELVNNKVSDKITNLSSSSGLKDLKTTTTEIMCGAAISPEWEDVDLSELHKRGVQFGKSQLVSLWSFLKSHSAFDFQESVDGFVYDIDNKNIQARKGYLNFFIGTIRHGQLYVSSHYVSPERKKMNEMIELAKKREQEKELYLAALEDEKFNQWLSEYGDENIEKQMKDASLLIDFKHRGKYAMDWVKQNIYRKLTAQNA
jgi:predicted transcriptional regulator